MSVFSTKQFWKNQLNEDWAEHLKPILVSQNMLNLMEALGKEYSSYSVFPSKKQVFSAFQECSLANLKVVIIGDEPYCDKIGTFPRATGVAFANPGHLINCMSKDLKAIRGQLEENFETLCLNFDPELKNWTSQGVLLLNTSLTVRENEKESHKILWKGFIKQVVKTLPKDTIYLIWAKDYEDLLPIIHNYFLCPGLENTNKDNPWFCNNFYQTKEIIKWI